MPQVEPDVNIENVVATGALKHGLDLNAIVNAFPDVEYRPEQFPGVVFRIKKPKTATLIFGSGKMVCTGARSKKLARKALMNVVNVLKTGGIIISGKPEIKIVNIVASVDLGGPIDLIELYELAREMRGRIIYEPDQFPGLIYRMQDPRAVFLVFSTGKLVCTGVRVAENVYKAVDKLHADLEEKEIISYS